MLMTNDLVLYDNSVWEVRWVSGASVHIQMQGVDFIRGRSVLIEEVTPLTKEVADCMLACDPPEVIVYIGKDRYVTGWSDPRAVFK